MSTHHITIGNIARTLLFVPAILMGASQPVSAQYTTNNPSWVSLNKMSELALEDGNNTKSELTPEQQEACTAAMNELLQGKYSPEQIEGRYAERMEAAQEAWFFKGFRSWSAQAQLESDQKAATELQAGVADHRCELSYRQFKHMLQKTN